MRATQPNYIYEYILISKQWHHTPLDIWNGKQCVKNICIFETIISSLVHAEFIIYIEHGEDLSEPEEWQQPTLFKTQLSGFILPWLILLALNYSMYTH